MGSPVLFHGPSARDAAVRHAKEVGRLACDPLGDAGLKVDDSRLVVELAGNSGVGDAPPVVIIGPIDRATPEASDALLKTLEDLAEGPLGIVLWTDHLGGVRDTICSRTLALWCPPEAHWSSPYQDEDTARLRDAFLQDDLSACLGIIYGRQKDWPDLLMGFCEALTQDAEDPRVPRIWDSIRPILDGKGSMLTAATAMLAVMT